MTDRDASNPQDEKITSTIKEAFNIVAKGYDCDALRFFSSSAEHLAFLLNLKGDENVLDVATGTGTAAIAIAARLPAGKVTGVDFSSGMLDQARNKARSLGLNNIDFIETDMRALAFPAGRFDAAVCSFGIFFVRDMDKQLNRIVNVVRPNGIVAITSFGEGQFRPLRQMAFDLLERYGVKDTANAELNEQQCRELFSTSGLQSIRIETKNVGYYLESEEAWWDVIWNAGFRRLVNQLAPDRLAKFKREHLSEIASLKTSNGIWLNAPVVFTVGIKA